MPATSSSSGESVWDCDGYYDEYVDVLGSATTQQVTRVNDAAWRSFFETVKETDREASPPGYWGNQADGRDLRTYIRNDAYTVSWARAPDLSSPSAASSKTSTASVGSNGSGLPFTVGPTGGRTGSSPPHLRRRRRDVSRPPAGYRLRRGTGDADGDGRRRARYRRKRPRGVYDDDRRPVSVLHKAA